VTPNVVLIVLDTARADAFEPYGAATGASPVVADLARRGLHVASAIAPSNWTLPSHASMFTGLLPRQLGLGQAPGGKPANCRPYLEAHADRLLPEVLRRAGYATGAVSTNLWISPWSGFGTGFDRFEEVTSGRAEQIHDNTPLVRARWALEAIRARVDDGASEVERILAGWIADAPSQPFFWFVNLVECHSPYLPPRPYNDLPPWQRLRAAEEARRHLTLSEIWKGAAGGYDIPEPTMDRMRHLYARSIRSMDDWLERLLSSLDGQGLLEDTIVIITSDHGENLGEGYRLGHAFWLDDRLIHVPLVVSGPGMTGLPDVVSLTDLPRLLAEAIGLDEHPWEDASGVLDGVAMSQSDALVPIGDERIERSLALWNMAGDAARYASWRLTTSGTAATDGTWKIVREGEDDWFYDLDGDPLEGNPTRLDDAEVAALDGARLGALRAALDHAAPSEGDPRQWAGPDLPDEREGIEDRMRLLGYL
jgi:arylsulfatase A-like enzyme